MKLQHPKVILDSIDADIAEVARDIDLCSDNAKAHDLFGKRYRLQAERRAIVEDMNR